MSDNMTRRARLTITSRHRILEPEKMGKFASLFADEPECENDEIAPEDYPNEMNDALRTIRALNGEYEEEPKDDEAIFEELLRRLNISPEQIDDPENNAILFCTEAELRVGEDGVIELEYTEDESMDGTLTVIRFDPSEPSAVTIFHNGSVMSSLICERRRRHISVYSTPIMPLEVAVYTRSLEGGFSAEGGEMELDYIVELRGMDIQRTMMKIRADVIG